VKRIVRPVAAGKAPTRKSSKAGPVWVPPADDVVALSDEIGGSPEVEIGECGTKSGHERFDVGVASARGVQRILQQHVGSGELVDDCEVAGLAPETGEPAADDFFVGLFFGHVGLSPDGFGDRGDYCRALDVRALRLLLLVGGAVMV
jgi:hypothetical protein